MRSRKTNTVAWIVLPAVVLVLCSVALASPLGNPGGEPVVTFPDIQGHWAQKDVERLVGWGIITGMPDGTFAPEAPVTRAQVAVLLKRTVNLVGFQTIVTRTFVNTTEHSVNDIHFEFAQGTDVLDPGPFGDISGNGTSIIRLSNPVNDVGDPAPIGPGGKVVLKFGTSAGSLRYKWWWWTKDGQQIGPKQGTGRAQDL
ncbi:MAG: S-layer homology domain-containing protein [Bacillota bacterium]|nr:S-layer homology domain-containing protein [Bacillota bacterium]